MSRPKHLTTAYIRVKSGLTNISGKVGELWLNLHTANINYFQQLRLNYEGVVKYDYF